MPATENTPFFSVTVPVEVVPSPQLIVAVKSPTAAFGLASVNVATVAVTDAPSVALIGEPLAVSAATAAMVIVIAAAFGDEPWASTSITLKLNVPCVTVWLLGTKISFPLAISAAEIVSFAVTAPPFNSSVPSVGSEVMVTPVSESAVSLPVNLKSATLNT